MVKWACTQCGENLEAPDGFSEVIECPKCGNHSRPRTGPPPVSVKAKPVVKKSKSPVKSKQDKKTSILFRKASAGTVLIVFGVIMLLVAMGSDTTVSSGDSYVQNLGLLNDRIVLAIVGAALLVSGSIFATRGSSD